MREVPCPAGASPRPHVLVGRAEYDSLLATGRLRRHHDWKEKRFCFCRWTLYWLDGREVALEFEEDAPATQDSGGTTTGNLS